MHIAVLILLAVLAISALTAAWMVRRKSAENAVKVMMFVGYFWLLTFLQVVLVVVLYLVRQHFFSV